jgi:3-hydroxyisobutyrate dehydrogenase
MAARLASADVDLWVFDVDSAAAEGFDQVAGSVAELGERCEVVGVMVRDDAQVREVLKQLLGTTRPDIVVTVHSTIHPDTAIELAAMAETRGVDMLDAPVSGGAMGASDGSLAIMAGGSEAAYERAKPVLDAMGSHVVRLGPAGAGTKAKLARNLLHFASFAAVAEAQRLAEAAGLDLEELGRIVRHTDAITGGPGAIMLRPTTAPMAPDDPWRPIFEHVRDLGEKDLLLAIELARSHGVQTPLAQLSLERLAAGLGLEDA